MKRLLTIFLFTLFVFTINAQQLPASSSAVKIDTINDPIQPERLPRFPGGKRAYSEFLNKNLNWPNQDDVQGRVIISFYVEKDGRLTNIKIEKSLGIDFDAEALRVIKKSPKWIPGTQNGKPVRVRYSLPISFTIAAE